MSTFANREGAQRSSAPKPRPALAPSRTQRSLAVAPTSDPLEHEAERVARAMTAEGGRSPLATGSAHRWAISEGPVRIAMQSADDAPAGLPTSSAEISVIWFPLDSDEPRNDPEISSDEHLELALARIAQHADQAGDEQQVLVHGYASTEGSEGHNLDLSGRRAIRVKNLLIDAGVPSGRIVVLAHGRDETWPELEWNRRVEIELAPSDAVVVRAPYCECPAGTQVDYSNKTISYIEGIAPYILAAAAAHGVPAMPIAGAIADEYDDQDIVDVAQDTVVPALREWMIDIDRYLDIEPEDLEVIVREEYGEGGDKVREMGAKLLNTLENDVGPANIKVRTALKLVEAGVIVVPGSPPGDIKVNVIIDYLMPQAGTDNAPGTVDATGGVIAQAQALFGPFVGEHSDPVRDAVFMEYFKQGDEYYGRFLQRRARGEGAPHACPGHDGCQFLHNYDRLAGALASGP